MDKKLKNFIVLYLSFSAFTFAGVLIILEWLGYKQ